MPVDVQTISPSFLGVKWKEQYASAALNRRLVGVVQPGIYRGLTPVEDPGAGDRTILIQADGTTNDHVALYETADGFAVSYRDDASGSFIVDLSSFSNVRVVVAIVIEYQISVDTTGLYRAYTETEFLALTAAEQGELVVLGTVDVPVSGAVPQASILGDYRTVSRSATPGGVVTGSELVDTLVDALTSRVEAPTAESSVSEFTLMWESRSSASTPAYRLYVKDDGEVQLVVNAVWDGTDWEKDQTGLEATRFLVQADKIASETVDSVTNTWLDSAWVRSLESNLGGLSVQGGVTLGQGLLSDYTVPRVETTVPVLGADRALLWRFNPDSGTTTTRVYGTGSGIDVTMNAVWDGGTNLWSNDATGDSLLFHFGGSTPGLTVRGRDGSGTWNDSQGDTGWNEVSLDFFATFGESQLWLGNVSPTIPSRGELVMRDGRARFPNITSDIVESSNPQFDTPITNELRAKNVIKAWLLFDGTTGTILDGFNVASLAGGGSLWTVNFAAAFANTNYLALPSNGIFDASHAIVTIAGSTRTVSSFQFLLVDETGGLNSAPNTTPIGLAFLGEQ